MNIHFSQCILTIPIAQRIKKCLKHEKPINLLTFEYADSEIRIEMMAWNFDYQLQVTPVK